ncbi:ketosteroid isomerase-like protein [Actinoalloteichus hoggarensis]|uniref:SnoaL-like domain protein n=1 Tax=Actinoalloteichus hoggarensis TaxID=1470176 RepID=A0A221VW07_9PSEU|nr:nuclear transport factor 2 family protein [Actinoalloteichus hoggarensis]ASO17703.1 SnoaL-like domain protein [Actinoalloteichus hoggarensis]MBB5922828.1 ketosteroid isomerase-like protein [Actinoalloteichus hoggarensis]
MVSTAEEQARRTIDRYLRLLADGDVTGVLELFTDDGVVRSPMNGMIPAREFYPELAATTARSVITPIDVYLSVDDPRCAAVRFRYDWRLPDDTATAFDCVDVLTLADDGRIAELRIVYDTHPLRMAWQASLPAP